MWRGVACLAAWVLIGWLAPVGPASAGIGKEAADRVAAAAGAAQGAVNALPPPSKIVPPPKAVPPPSKVVPSPPPPPVPPRTPSKPTGNAPSKPAGNAPSKVPSTPSQAPSGAGGHAPADGGLAGVAGDAGGSVKSVGGEASDPVSPAPSEGGNPTPAAGGESAAAGKKTRLGATGTAKRTPLAVGPADVAAVRRWFARVWPAIALGGEDGRGSLPAVIAAELFQPLIAAADRSLQAVAAVVRAVGDGGASPAGNPVQPNAPHGFLSNVAAAADWKKIVYLVALAVLLGLLAFTVWREFRSALRPYAR